MVKITYDFNNKKDVEMVENYYWLKYQFDVLNFDVFKNTVITKHFTVLRNLKIDEQEIIKRIVLSFSNENDLTKMAEILNKIYESSLNYVEWLNVLYLSGTKDILRIYKWELIEKFKNN